MRSAMLVLLLFSTPALAAPAIALPSGAPVTHTLPDGTDVTRDARLDPGAISLRDCESDVSLNVPLTLGGWSDEKLEAWVGTGCEVDATRTTACWHVLPKPITPSTAYTATVRARDIVAQTSLPQKTAYAPAAESVCRTQTSGPGPIAVNLYFIWETSDDKAVAGAFVSTPVPVDLRAADPPAWKDVGAGDTLLDLAWTPLVDSDTVAYRVFISPKRGTAPPPTADAGVCPSPFPAPIDGGAASPDLGDAFDQQDFQGVNTAGGQLSGLVDDATYALTVAAVDRVGNVGPLGAVRCGTPRATLDFWETYRNAGGGAGGSCSVGPTGPWSPLPPLLLVVAGLAFLLARQRSSPARTPRHLVGGQRRSTKNTSE